ncbi:hypothetical protein ACHAWF_017694 [Thalassiosira exigua]
MTLKSDPDDDPGDEGSEVEGSGEEVEDEVADGGNVVARKGEGGEREEEPWREPGTSGFFKFTPVGEGARGDEPPYLRIPRGTPGVPPGVRSRDALDIETSSASGALAALSNLGVVHERQGELDAALACHERVLACARTVRSGSRREGPTLETARALTNGRNCLQRAPQVEEARERVPRRSRSARGSWRS